MRVDGFLRTPLRGDQQRLIRDLVVAESPLRGDPDPAAPYPQTLELTFSLPPDSPAIQVAPLWEGTLSFVPATTRGQPTVPAEVSPDRFDRWSVTGDLVLRTWAMTEFGPSGFHTHLPWIDPAPSLVRYGPVTLTREFLFQTLANAPRHTFDLGGVRVAADDPQYAQKRVISLLSGTGGLWCGLDPADPTKDAALLPMPVVARPAGASSRDPYVLRVAIASTCDEALSPTWFDPRPAYDQLTGEVLVVPALRTLTNQLTNPAHPAQSVIPARAIFGAAPAAAFAPDQPVGSALRDALVAALPGGLRYRRVLLRRPPIPGAAVGAAPQRPFPAHQLCWRPVSGGAIGSLRLPLSGAAYLPLADGDYRFWVVARSVDPTAVDHGDLVRLSLPPVAPRLAGGPPQPALDVTVGAGAGTVIDAHLRDYDSAMAWEGFRVARGQLVLLQHRASAAWNVNANFTWIVPRRTVRPPQSALYGLFRESAGRHGLAPEFLQVVFFGEGGNLVLPAGGAFDPDAVLDAYGFVGLDLIVYRTGRLPVGRPAVPPEVPAGATEERAEYAFNLVTAGYVDPAVAAAVTWKQSFLRSEGAPRTLEIGTIAGWPAAIELVAAELHARLEEMTAYLAAKAPPVPVTDELTRRFLAYLRFNTSPARARTTADNLGAAVRAWTGPWPPDNLNARYNTLQRIAITAWEEESGAYREALAGP